jgi:hypothetical protein
MRKRKFSIEPPDEFEKKKKLNKRRRRHYICCCFVSGGHQVALCGMNEGEVQMDRRNLRRRKKDGEEK